MRYTVRAQILLWSLNLHLCNSKCLSHRVPATQGWIITVSRKTFIFFPLFTLINGMSQKLHDEKEEENIPQPSQGQACPSGVLVGQLFCMGYHEVS